MRGIHRQFAVRGEQAAEPAGGAVEPVGQLIEVGHPVPAAERTRVTRPEPPRRFGELFHRPGQPPGEHRGQPGGQRGGHDGQHGQHGQHGRSVAGADHQRGHGHNEDGDGRHGEAGEP